MKTILDIKNINIPHLKFPHLQKALNSEINKLLKRSKVKGIAIFGSIGRGD